MTAVCHEAALYALEQDLDARLITMEHLRHAVTTVTRRTTDAMIQFYDGYYEKFGSKK